MSVQTNKQAARRLIEEAWNQGKLEVVDQVVAPDSVGHDPARPKEVPDGPQGMKQMIQMYRSAFPDLRFTVDDLVGEGEEVVVRFTATGTHEGNLMGIPPTGKKTTISGIAIDRFDHGKIVEAWVNWDQLGQMRQLGLLPSA